MSRHFRPISIAVAASVFSATPVYVYAQDGTAVREISIEGAERLETDTVRSYMAIAEGDTVDAVKIDKALKALYATGMFADVTIHQEGDRLLVRVVENPIINRVVFEGNHKVKKEDLEKEVQLKARAVFSRTKVQEDEKRILDIYRRDGRFAASVEPKIIQLPQNRVDLVFEITEGPATYVQRINFIGNTQFTEDDLKEILETKEERWWRFLSSSDTYDPDRMDYDRELLRRFYLSKGYADFRVVSAVAELSPDRTSFFMTFTVDEGERYKISSIDVKSAIRALGADTLRATLDDIDPGDWYNSALVDKDVDRLTDYAGDRGYAFVDVRANVERNHDARTLALTFDVHEAPRVFVERVDITGNDVTLDKVIRREMRLAEGDAFNASKLKRSKERLKNLDFFDTVEVNDEASATAPDQTVIKVAVTEKHTGEVNFGIGYSSAYGPMVSAGIAQNNVLGTGERASLQGSFALNALNGNLGWLDPYFYDHRLAVGADLFASNTNRFSSFDYAAQTIGADVKAGWAYNEYWSQQVKYTVSETSVNNVLPGASLYIIDQQGINSLSMVGQSITYDRRDVRLNTTKGYYVSYGTDVAGLLGSEHFIRNSLSAGQFYPIAENWIASLTATFGYMDSWDGTPVHINNLYFLGANSGMRGFKIAGISPRDDASGDAIGGSWEAVGSAQLKLPLGLPKEYGIGASLFSDFGTIGPNPEGSRYGPVDESTAIRMSVGTGLTWKSPMGPIEIDIAYPLVRTTYDKIQILYLNFGQRF